MLQKVKEPDATPESYVKLQAPSTSTSTFSKEEWGY